MKRSLTNWIAAGLLAGAVLTPTAAYALPVDPGEAVGAVADSLPVNPLGILAHSNTPAYTGLPVDVVGAATAAVGTIREALPFDPIGMMPLPASAQSAVTVPPRVPCLITPAINALPLEGHRATAVVSEKLPVSLVCTG